MTLKTNIGCSFCRVGQKHAANLKCMLKEKNCQHHGKNGPFYNEVKELQIHKKKTFAQRQNFLSLQNKVAECIR